MAEIRTSEFRSYEGYNTYVSQSSFKWECIKAQAGGTVFGFIVGMVLGSMFGFLKVVL